MYSAVLRGLNKFTFLDYFKFRGQVKPKTGPMASVTGFSGTVLLIVIVLAYCINATIRFLQTPDSVDVTRLPTEQQDIQLMPTCVSIPFLNDRRYFAYDFQQVVVQANGTKQKIPIRITSNAATGVGDPNKFCINSNATRARLRGFCSPGNCSFIQFHLWTCGATDRNNPTYNATNCMSHHEIGQVLETNYVDVTYTTALGVVVLHATPKINAAALFVSNFVYNQTTIMPDLIRRFFTSYETNLVHDGDNYALSYFFNKETPSKPVLEVQMVMSSSWTRTVASHRTSADLLSAFGAFFGVVHSVLAYIFFKHNEKKFYEREENWARIDDDFKTVPHGEEYVPTTSEGKTTVEAVKRSSNDEIYSRQDELSCVARESLNLMVDNVQ